MSRLLVTCDDSGEPLASEEVARLLLTLVSGGTTSPFYSTLTVLDTLLSLPPDQLEGARQAARHGEDEVLRNYALEAMRLAPFPFVVFRYCERDTLIARGTARERPVSEGTLLALLITSANRDPERISDPHRFRVGRPVAERLLFGHSLHYCFGDAIGMEMITQIVKVVLLQPALRRAPGPDGRKQTGDKGRYPDFFFPARMVAEVHDL